jgi:hypothetical protein
MSVIRIRIRRIIITRMNITRQLYDEYEYEYEYEYDDEYDEYDEYEYDDDDDDEYDSMTWAGWRRSVLFRRIQF